jgi:hypothetical protein
MDADACSVAIDAITSGDCACRCLIPHKPRTCFLRGRAHRWIRCRSFGIRFLGGRACRSIRCRSFGIRFLGGRACRWIRCRSFGIRFLCGLAQRWSSRRSFGIGVLRGRARRFIRLLISGMCFLVGRRRLHSSYICFFCSRAHRCRPPSILGTGSLGGCEGNSCGSEASRALGVSCFRFLISKHPARRPRPFNWQTSEMLQPTNFV